MKNEFYISKTKKSIIKISSIIHCGLIHHSILEKDNITRKDVFNSDNTDNPDCIYFNMSNNHNIIMYCENSEEAKTEFNKLLKLIQENGI